MTTSAERITRIEALTPRQALDIVQYLTAWLDERRPDLQEFTAEQQVEILNTLFQEDGYAPLPLSVEATPDEPAGGQAARRLLALLTESADAALLDELGRWLAKPPESATRAGLAEVIVLPIVLTACTVVLGTSVDIERKNGATKIKVTRKGLSAKELVKGIYGTLQALLGLG